MITPMILDLVRKKQQKKIDFGIGFTRSLV